MPKPRLISQVKERNGLAIITVRWDADFQEYTVGCLADGSDYQTTEREDAYNQRDYLLHFYYSKG